MSSPPLDTAKLRALYEKADVSSPWYFKHNEKRNEWTVGCDDLIVADLWNENDPALIVGAVNALPALLDEVDRLRKACEFDNPLSLRAEITRLIEAGDAMKAEKEAEVARLRADLAAVTEERDRLKAETREWTETEASLCPEDCGIEEYVPALQSRCERAEARVAEVEAGLRHIQDQHGNCQNRSPFMEDDPEDETTCVTYGCSEDERCWWCDITLVLGGAS